MGQQQAATVLKAEWQQKSHSQDKCSTYLCSLFYKVTENCRERILPVESNGSLGAPLFFGQQLSIKPLESEAWEWRSLETGARHWTVLFRDTDLTMQYWDPWDCDYPICSLHGGRSFPKF